MIPMEEKLLDLFARLSRSSTRSRVYAMKAKKDERHRLAKLFLALAESQAMQARRFLMQIRGTINATEDNEKTVFDDELPRTIEEYKRLMTEAEQKGYRALTTGFQHSVEVNQLLLELYDTLDEQDAEKNFFVCNFCGYVAVDEPPDNCPICTAPKPRFQKVDAE